MPSGPSVTARDLNEALQQMHSRKMYRKLVSSWLRELTVMELLCYLIIECLLS